MEDKDMQYDFDKFPKRGLVYIIVNERFNSEGFPDRCGAYTDYKNMKKMFKPLKFKLMTFYDKTAKQIKSILSNASQRPDLAERPCFMCIISSHGEQWSETQAGQVSRKRTMEHAIVGVDGKRVLTKELVDLFSEANCPQMSEKPKLFFIQACRETVYSDDRSKALDEGVTVQYIVSAKLSKHRRIKRRLSLNPNYDSSDSKPIHSDVLDELRDEIIETRPGNMTEEKKDQEEEEEFSDGYDTATTDNDSDGEDEDRETGHDDIRNRDRSEYTQKNKDITLEGGVFSGVQHIEAITPDDTPTDVADAGGRGPSKRRIVTDIQEIEPVEVTAIPCHEDMLVMFASPPGKLAWRSTTEGGWLLANLYNVFKHSIRNSEILERDFLTLLTEVSHDVSHKETNTDNPKYNAKKMVPTIYHQLTKEIVMCSIKKTGLLQKLAEKTKELIQK